MELVPHTNFFQTKHTLCPLNSAKPPSLKLNLKFYYFNFVPVFFFTRHWLTNKCKNYYFLCWVDEHLFGLIENKFWYSCPIIYARHNLVSKEIIRYKRSVLSYFFQGKGGMSFPQKTYDLVDYIVSINLRMRVLRVTA